VGYGTGLRRPESIGPSSPRPPLRAALTQAKGDGLLDRVPKIRMLRTVEAMPRILTPDEIRCVLDHAGGLRPLIATAASTGLRAAELRWLWWEDVDLEASTIEVRAKLSWHGARKASWTKPSTAISSS
jgi:integrase